MFRFALRELRTVQADLADLCPSDVRAALEVDKLLKGRGHGHMAHKYSLLGYAAHLYHQTGVKPATERPVTAYGKAVLNLLLNESEHTVVPRDTLQTGFCMEAELRLMEALTQAATKEVVGEHHRPMVIVADASGEPFGVVKQRGDCSLYSWRAADIPTSYGTVYMPAASFSELSLAPGQHIAHGRSVQQVVLSVGTVRDAQFGRFDNTHLSDITRRAIAEDVVYGEEKHLKLEDFIDPAVMYTPDYVAQLALSFLDR